MEYQPNSSETWKLVSVLVLLLLVVSLTLIVVFKREWVDNLVFGPILQTQENSSEIDVDFNISLDLIPVSSGTAELYFNLPESMNIAGFELSFVKESSLNVSEFVCAEPFECVPSDFNDTAVSIVGLTPVFFTEAFPFGRLLLGELQYSGSGTLTLERESFVSDVLVPEENILDFSKVLFELN